MRRKRISIELDDVPRMLGGIIEDTLKRSSTVDLVSLDDATVADPLDVLVTFEDTAYAEVERLLLKVRQLVLIDRNGTSAVLHNRGERPRQIYDLSPSRLLFHLGIGLAANINGREPGGAEQIENPGSVGGSGSHPDWQYGGTTGSGRSLAAVRAGVAGLAAAILTNRAGSLGQTGPAEELAALARSLSEGAADVAVFPPGLERASFLFGLSPTERDLLLLAAAVEVDPLMARLVGLLNDHRGRSRPTVGLVADLGGDPAVIAAGFVSGGPFARFALADLDGDGPVSMQAVIVPRDLWPLILGFDRKPPFEIAELSSRSFGDLPIPQELVADLDQVADATLAQAANALVTVAGDPGTGRRDIASVFASRLRRHALNVTATDLPTERDVARLMREAVLAHAAIVVSDPEKLPGGLWGTLSRRREAPLIAVTEERHLPRLAIECGRPLMQVAAPRGDAMQRLRMWAARAPADWSSQALQELAERFSTGSAEIGAALDLAEVKAAAAGRAKAKPEDARKACEMLRDVRFEGTAERLECPFEPGDIVLRQGTQAELDLVVAWATHGLKLFSPGGTASALKAGGGMACLFSGPPGTGKTMAAQIIARQADYALYRIDLSQVVNKYIGESEKRLSAVFDEAARSRVALFFDEADALFGKRTEVRDSHDRYANITVDHLLQRIETFEGLVILATNLPGNIDDAFLRRVRVRAEFSPPDAADRRSIWERLLPAKEERSPDIDIPHLADPFELVGGEIRNAVYTAHLLAAQEGQVIAMRHCISGLWREQGKVGRLTDKSHLGQWRGVVEHDIGRSRPFRRAS